MEILSIGQDEEIDNINGTWLKIRTAEDIRGWSFDGSVVIDQFD